MTPARHEHERALADVVGDAKSLWSLGPSNTHFARARVHPILPRRPTLVLRVRRKKEGKEKKREERITARPMGRISIFITYCLEFTGIINSRE